MAITKTGESQEFAYTGGMQTFVVPQTGLYMLEVWGAQGGNYGGYDIRYGGLGGYSKGYATLKKGDILYICVGRVGYFYGSDWIAENDYNTNGGYNGGGGVIGAQSTYSKSSGGGATHIGTFNSTLAAHGNTDGLYIVAGGGGGASGGPDGNSNPNGYGRANGGSGGGLNGGNGGISVDGVIANGGGQNPPTSGNTAFGVGGTVAQAYAGAGGGGLYGGCSGSQSGSGGGGSGYIGGVPTIKYRGKEYIPETKNGVQSGNGKARITFVEKSIPLVFAGGKEIIAMYRGNKQVIDVKISGGGQK